MVGLILVVTTKTQLRYFFDQVVINVRAMWIVAGRATTLPNRTVNRPRTVRHNRVVASDTKRFRGKLEVSGILRFMRAMTERAKTQIRGGMLIRALCQPGVAAGTLLSTACGVVKFVFAGIIGNMTGTTKLLIGAAIMHPRAPQEIRVA